MNIEKSTLSLDRLEYSYPNGKRAVSGVSLEVEPGTVFGLIGPNGAGKSTLLNLAAGLLTPSTGQVLSQGVELTGVARKAAHWIGLMSDPLGVYTDISSSEYLEFFARLLFSQANQRRRRIDEVIDLLALEP